MFDTLATSANEVLLLEHAKLMTASQLEKLCRRYALVQRHGEDRHPQGDEQRRYVRRRDTEDGMVKIEAVPAPGRSRDGLGDARSCCRAARSWAAIRVQRRFRGIRWSAATSHGAHRAAAGAGCDAVRS